AQARAAHTLEPVDGTGIDGGAAHVCEGDLDPAPESPHLAQPLRDDDQCAGRGVDADVIHPAAPLVIGHRSTGATPARARTRAPISPVAPGPRRVTRSAHSARTSSSRWAISVSATSHTSPGSGASSSAACRQARNRPLLLPNMA